MGGEVDVGVDEQFGLGEGDEAVGEEAAEGELEQDRDVGRQVGAGPFSGLHAGKN